MYTERWKAEGRRRRWGEPAFTPGASAGNYHIQFQDRNGEQKDVYFRSLNEALWWQQNVLPYGRQSTLRPVGA